MESNRYLLLAFQHGEPGAAVADLQPVDIVVSHVLKQILSTVCEYLLTLILCDLVCLNNKSL